MARGSRRPNRYRVRVQLRGGTADCLVEHGFCTAADAELLDWVGKSAAWIYGHMVHERMKGQMLPPPDAPRQGMLL